MSLTTSGPPKFYSSKHTDPRVIEEDEYAQIADIFKHFDHGNRGRVSTSELPTILRLLQHNIGEEEDKELRYEVDPKNRGTFTMRDLIDLLSKLEFQEDSQEQLLLALRELDTDADGFIEISCLAEFLKSVGEPFSQEELDAYQNLCESETSEKPGQIDIKKFADLILPPMVVENDLRKGVSANN